LDKDGPVASPAIRRAVPTDAAAVRTVIERAIRISAAGAYPAGAVEAWAGGGTVEAVRRMIEGTEGLVATVDRAIVGWANLGGNEVEQLYVDPDVGGQGIARRLYEAVEELARNNGLGELRAIASLRAEPAFRRFGFRETTREERIFHGQTFTIVRMAKHLDESGYR